MRVTRANLGSQKGLWGEVLSVGVNFQAGFQASASMSGGVLEGASPSIEWGGFGTCLPLIEWGRFAMAYTPVEVIHELLTFIGGWTWELGKDETFTKKAGSLSQKVKP